ncbi:FAD-dependent oxidoreductase [Arenibaculum pallidiluteum]|uniref:FAD-dependent oxidoreductase n=1 Tax=Arenibaculum pallidiluteum TaxID=2812559 RepID=UPI001A95AA69|nr:FAD-dependent oxidoreductase [Arenibaculum pallidiluteum]
MEAHRPIEVLICGAGPSGLTLAIDLARRGVSFRLIDKLAAPFAGSRGKGIQPRTQEVFEDLGVLDRIAAVGGHYPPQHEYRPDGSSFEARNFVAGPPTVREPYPAPLLVPQFRTEAVLRERLAEFGFAPEYGRELTGFEQDAEGVTVQVRGPHGIETIRCAYLVGGDGGRSFIRLALQIGFPGRTLGVRAIVADIRADGLTRDSWHEFNHGDLERQLSFCPLPHTDLFQLQAPIPLAGDVDLSPAGLQAFIDARLPGVRIVVRGVSWASAYSMSARLADRYRVRRVFLMGDAAHVHPPTGGQGLNTSVQDAYNLGWKLDAVLAGAPDTLLDTYEEERRPIAAAMLGLSTNLLDRAKQGDMRRGRDVLQLDLSYAASSLSLDLPVRHAGVKPGDRAPDATLRGAGGQPRRLFDLFQGPHWTLIGFGADPASLPAAGRRLHVHGIGSDGEFRDVEGHFGRIYSLSRGDLMLVRPDGYVGALAGAADAGRIADHLAGMGALGRGA